MNAKLPPPNFKGHNAKVCKNCAYCEIISVKFGRKSNTICKITGEGKTVHSKCNVYIK